MAQGVSAPVVGSRIFTSGLAHTMAVLIEGLSVVVRCASIEAKHPGGHTAFACEVPNGTLCADGELARVGFMRYCWQRRPVAAHACEVQYCGRGYAADLISTAAVIYAKIAWHHGYEVRVDSPYIPPEWLPTEPLERYDDHYGFLK
jgi:hypothetical protein